MSELAETATAEAAAPPRPDLPPEVLYLNRELSMLAYMERVLGIAEDPARPLLERVAFLAMSCDAVDDFFQIRVAGLKEQQESPQALTSPDGLTPARQLRAIRGRVEGIVERHTRLYVEDLKPELREAGIVICDASQLSDEDRRHLTAEFRERIFPVLTPLAVDPGHPFPYISNLSLNLAVLVRDPLRRRLSFARLKVPPLLPRFVALPDGERFIPLEQVIADNLQLLFPGMEVAGHHVFRVTRDADLDDVDSEAEDLLAAIQTELRRRRRRARGVRLEVEPGMSSSVLPLLIDELDLAAGDVYTIDRLLGLNDLMMLTQLDRPDLKPERWTPTTQPRLGGAAAVAPDFFGVISAGDVLLHHPYDSFATSVESFIAHAAADPNVLAIKQTLYRTSGPASAIARSLVLAAEAGKQVVALVELKARGDEQANITWAQALEEAGVHVVYGLVGLKTHAKVLLVVRQEEDGIRRYVHIGTGNYNARTAASYEDIGLLSANAGLGADVSDLFNYLTGYSRQRRYHELMVAPAGVRPGMLKLIAGEAHQEGRIVIKVNNLVDPEIIDALYAAGQAGARIDLIVRSISCLRPGYPGLSENIRVRSIVGRFLEHSRIFRFGPDARAQYFIGSPDLMERNLDRRVEAVVPVKDAALRKEIQGWLDLSLADDTLAWTLDAEGSWTKVPTTHGLDVQAKLQEVALERAHGR
ncbi:MAG TPA: polyphosphate kinase 1 [Candidatus Dormibacteraeota bacterium]|jgi:polyphosphate kinase